MSVYQVWVDHAPPDAASARWELDAIFESYSEALDWVVGWRREYPTVHTKIMRAAPEVGAS